MVKLLSVFALFAMAIVVPAQDAGDTETPGFWEKWVEAIEANPDTAPSPEAAWEAYNTTIHERSLNVKRATGTNCDLLNGRANGPACVRCIDTLARRGKNGKKCGVGCTGPDIGCKNDGCTISAQTSPTCRGKINCNGLARAAGKVMDKCYRADQTVAGNSYAPAPNDWAYIHVQHG